MSANLIFFIYFLWRFCIIIYYYNYLIVGKNNWYYLFITELSWSSDTKPELCKAIYSDYISIIKEAARNNYDPENLSDYLQTTGIFNDTQIQKLCQIYYKQIKTPMILHLSSIGDSHPCIVDISWRLDYCLKVILLYWTHQTLNHFLIIFIN